MYSTDVNPGDGALVKLQAMKGRTVQGKVTRTAWALDPKTRTIRTEIDIPNPGGKLRPGLYAYATVIVEEHRDVMTIPTTAIIQEKDKAFCVTSQVASACGELIGTGLSDGTRTQVNFRPRGTNSCRKGKRHRAERRQAVTVARRGYEGRKDRSCHVAYSARRSSDSLAPVLMTC